MTAYWAEVPTESWIRPGERWTVHVMDESCAEGLPSVDTGLVPGEDYSREEVTAAACSVLSAAGWRITGEWGDGVHSYRAGVVQNGGGT